MKQSDAARAQIAELHRHFRDNTRPEAARNLTVAIREAIGLINAGHGIPAPRPYPELARAGPAWVHAGRDWIRFSTTKSPVILNVFYGEADIPVRL